MKSNSNLGSVKHDQVSLKYLGEYINGLIGSAALGATVLAGMGAYPICESAQQIIRSCDFTGIIIQETGFQAQRCHCENQVTHRCREHAGAALNMDKT